MGMLDQMLANLYKPAKQEKPLPLSGKQSAQLTKALTASQAAQLVQTTVAQGQFLRGEVLDLRAHQILVLLENGATVSARTEGTLNLSIGENARFFVSQTTEDQVILKLAKEDSEAENPMIEKALTAAGISRTEKSVAIVTELLSHSQPVTGENIRHYLSLSAKYPELPVKDFVLMELHQIPVNADTVAQFAAYHDGNGKLLTQAVVLINELSAQLEKLPEGEIKQQLMQEFAQVVTIETGINKNTGLSVPDTRDSAPLIGQPTQTLPDTDTPSQNPADNTALPQAPGAVTTPDARIDTEPLSLSKDFLDFFLLTPAEVADSDKVKEYYEELNTKLEALEQLTIKLAETTKEPVITAPKQMRSNLSFMESVNQVFPFLQLPLKFAETPAHGELYVYERKKALKPSDSFSALLHLDMEALGSMDVFITLAGQNVTTRFSMTDKASADFIQAELPSLSDALAKKGYSLQTNVTIREKEATENIPTLLEQFLEEHAPGGLERYTFDIRA